MFHKTRLFTPGPTPLLPAAQFAMAAADLHHRTPEFRALYQRVLEQLKAFVGTKNDVILLTSSGTGAMEASISNLTSPGDRVLVLTAGKFGERWTGLAKAFGCQPDVVSAPYGQTLPLDAAKAALRSDTKLVLMQATETSTGVRHDVQAVAEMLRSAGSDALLVVDAITGLGNNPSRYGCLGNRRLDWRIAEGGDDSAGSGISGRQRACMEADGDDKKSALLFRSAQGAEGAAKGESAYTPGVALIAALGAAFDYIAAQADGDLAKGRVALVENAETCAAMMRAAVPAMGMRLFAPDAPAAAVTAVMPPEGVDSGIIVKQLKARFGTIVANGQGEMKGQFFRVAHLGFFDPLDTLAVIGALEQVTVDSLPPSKFQLGDALAAAQRVFAERSRSLDAASTNSSKTIAVAEPAGVGR